MDEGWEPKWSSGLLVEFSLQSLEEWDVLKQWMQMAELALPEKAKLQMCNHWLSSILMDCQLLSGGNSDHIQANNLHDTCIFDGPKILDVDKLVSPLPYNIIHCRI